MVVQFSSLQILVSMILPVWLIVFPILLLRKINYLTELLHAHLDEHEADDEKEE